MTGLTNAKRIASGRFSPLRYPGGKGKLARFITSVIRLNGLQDGCYIEPFAGGAAVACELLQTGVVRRIHINDLSRPIYAFWNSITTDTESLIKLIADTPLNIQTWEKMKLTFSRPDDVDDLHLGFAMFYLNRTNRSGILNGGPIGGRAQTGLWDMAARFNRTNLIERVTEIGKLSRRITVTRLDAIDLLAVVSERPAAKTLIYLDPPYFEKGRHLYYDYYKEGDHKDVSYAVRSMKGVSWIVSYDDVAPIHGLYSDEQCLRYEIGYSARDSFRGSEAMFFSKDLTVPSVEGTMSEIDRKVGKSHAAPTVNQALTC